MKKYILLIFACIYAIHLNAQNAGINFLHGTTWAEAVAKAKAENKLIFIDFYVAVSSGINRHFFLFATLAESQSHFDLLIGIGDLKSELCSFCSGKGTQRKAKYHDGF